MADTLRIDIDVAAARKALESLSGSFNTFKQAANNATSGASAAITKLNAALANIKQINPAILSGLQTINTTLAGLSTGNLGALADALGRINGTASGVSQTADALKKTQEALNGFKAPEGIDKLNVRFSSAAQGATRLTAAQKALAAEQRATANAIRSLGSELLNAGGFMAGIGVTAGKIAGDLKTLASTGQSIGTVFAGLKSTLGEFGAVAAVFTGVVIAIKGLYSAVTSVVGPIYDVGAALNSFRLTLDSIDGKGSGATTLEALSGVADRTSQDILTLTKNFAGFRAATEATGMEASQSLKIYEQFSGAFGALGLDTQKAEKGFLALTQMFSKGKVQAEELRGQLGDALPGAFVYAAESMGVTTAALDGMLKAGTVMADDLIPKLGQFLQIKFADAIAKQADTAAGQLTKFRNNVTLLLESLATGNFGGVMGGIAEGMKRINEAVSSPSLKEFAKVMGDVIGILVNGVLSVIGSIANGFLLFFDAIQKVVSVLGTLLSPLKSTYDYLNQNNIIMKVISASLATVGNALGVALAAWFTFGGAVKLAGAAVSLFGGTFGTVIKLMTPFSSFMLGLVPNLARFVTSLNLAATAQTVFAAATNRANLAMAVSNGWNTITTGATGLAKILSGGLTNGFVLFGRAMNGAMGFVVSFGAALVRLASFLTLPGLGILIGTLIALREPLMNAVSGAYEWAKAWLMADTSTKKAVPSMDSLGQALLKLNENASKNPEVITNMALANMDYEQSTKDTAAQIALLEDQIKANKVAFADDADAMKEANEPLEKLKDSLELYGVALDDSSQKIAGQAQAMGIQKGQAAELANAMQELNISERERMNMLKESAAQDRANLDTLKEWRNQLQSKIEATKADIEAGRGNAAILERQISMWQKGLEIVESTTAAIATQTAAKEAFTTSSERGIDMTQALSDVSKELQDTYGASIDQTKAFDAALKVLVPSLDKQKDSTKQVAENQDKLQQASGQTAEKLQETSTKMDSTRASVDALSTSMSASQETFNAASASFTSISGSMTTFQTSVASLVATLPSLVESLTVVTATVPLLVESMTPANEQFLNFSTQATVLGTSLPLLNEQLLTMGATFQTLAPTIQLVAQSFESLKGVSAALTSATETLRLFIDEVNNALQPTILFTEKLADLAAQGDEIRKGYETAGKAGAQFIDDLSRVESAVGSLIAKMQELKSAAEEALRAAQQAQQQSGGGGGGGQRDGGYSEENVYKSSSLVGSELLKTAPKFAEGTANTSHHVSRLAGGGIPSILHPNEAVVPLPKGRKIPVDLNLKLAEPPVDKAMSEPANRDSLGMNEIVSGLRVVSQKLDRVADAVLNVTPALARAASSDSIALEQATAAVTDRLAERVTTLGTKAGENAQNFLAARMDSGTKTTPDGLAPPSRKSVGGDNQRSPSVSQAPASNVVINLNVKTDDVEGFRRSQDQIARQLSDKIRRANRRNG